MAKYDFTPPTEEEKTAFESAYKPKYDFAPPTEEEKAAFESGPVTPKEPSTFSDLLSGGAQGLTFGFSDEIAAALEAAKDVAFTDKTLKDLPSLYRQLQESKQKELAEARERSPGAYLTGELGGALLPSLFTFGATAPASALTTGATAARELSALAKIGKAAKTGAAIGAVTGAGTSEAPLLSGEGLAETAKGAAVGGLIGGIGTGLMEGAKKGYRALAAEHRPIEELGVAAKEGFEKRGFTSKSQEAFRRAEEVGTTESFMKKLLGTPDEKGVRQGGLRQVYGKAIQESLEDATEKGVGIGKEKITLDALTDFGEVLEQHPRLLDRFQREQMEQFLPKLADGTLSPVEANEARRILKRVVSEAGDIPFDVKRPFNDLASALKTELDIIPGFKKANEEFASLMKNIPESVISKLPEDFRTEYFTMTARGEEKVAKALTDIIKRGGKPGEPGFEARGLLEKLKVGITEEFEKSPEKFRAAGINSPEEMYSKLEEVSKISGIRQGLIGEEPHSGVLKRILALLTPRGASLRAAQFAGRGVRGAQDIASTAYKLPDEALRLVSKKITESGSERLKPIAAALEQSIASGNQRAKHAAMFTLLQHKEGRDALNSE